MDAGRSYSSGRSSARRNVTLVWMSLAALLCGFPAPVHPQQSPEAAQTPDTQPAAQATVTLASQQPDDVQLRGTISGTVSAQTGAVLVGARITLAREDRSPVQETLSTDDGQFSFSNISPGPFQITIAAEGFSTQTYSGVLHPGEACMVPQISLAVTTGLTEVSVVVPRVEVAEEEIKAEEQQRVFGIIPNFYVSYVPDAAPLTTKQKFELTWRASIDPITFAAIGFFAGIEQAQNHFSGYGQGAEGYGKRFGAGFADTTIGAFIGGAILPSILKQDPRYFYKGTGSFRQRFLYALATAVICKSDRGHWQPNYSSVLGDLAAGGISNLYYPASDRGATLVFENTAIGIGITAISNVFQEFVVRKLTPHLPAGRDTTKH